MQEVNKEQALNSPVLTCFSQEEVVEAEIQAEYSVH